MLLKINMIVSFFAFLTQIARSSESSLFNEIDDFIAKTLTGIELTALYTISLGSSYPPIDQDVTFWCVRHKKKHLHQTYFNDPDIHSKLNLKKPVNFIIHGWLGGLNGGNIYLPVDVKQSAGWIGSTAINWAKLVDCNVCAVDWSRLANYDYSIAAMQNTKMVTSALAHFMEYLILKGMNVTHVSMVGHSLGAHIAGFIGERFKGALHSIYGLDPAGPGYTAPLDLGPNTRLDSSDARYVQCVLTSRATLGPMKDCGHANFIMNGGFIQPGCFTVLCSHSRSHSFFAESIFPKHEFIGEQCSGSFKFFFLNKLLKRSCSKKFDKLGIYSKRISGRFFVRTSSSPPYVLPYSRTSKYHEK